MTSGDEASVPITKPPEDQLSALALSDADGQENGVVYETPRGDNHSEIENEDDATALTDSAPPQAEESSDGGGGTVWARTNSEVEVDAPESPSSSRYAGGSHSGRTGRSGRRRMREREKKDLERSWRRD